MSFVAPRVRAFALLLGVLTVAAPLRASTVIYRTDAQLIALSERVVHGRVVAQRAARGGPQGQTIYTVTTLQIIEDLTGIGGSTVEVWELGGVIGDEFLYVGGAVEYRLGQEVLVCLERGPQGLRSVAMGFSAFDVVREPTGDRGLRRNLLNTVVLGGAATARQPTLSEFRRLATEITGRQPHLGLAPAAGEAVPGVSQPFTLLGDGAGYRWVQADSGTPVVWYKNTSAPNPLLSGDAVSEIKTALSAWTAPPTASIVLQYGGTTFQSIAKGPWTGIPSDSGVITFEDPYNEMSGSTLAIGGGWGSSGGGTVNGHTFDRFTRGYVIFANAVDLSLSFRQSLNFSRVLEHEIGHAIGLGHTQWDGTIPNATSNIMYPSCCNGDTPLPPALGPDDLNGLNYIYPESGSPCTFSVNPTSASWAASGGSGSATVSTQPGCAWTALSNAAFLSIGSGTPGNGPGTVNYSVAASAVTVPRSGTLTIAGQTVSVNQAAAACSYTLTPASASAPPGGGTGTVAVLAQPGCSWAAVSNSSFLFITSANSGSGNGSVSYQVSGNGLSARAGTLTIGGQTFTLNQFGTGPMVTLDKTSLRYGATISGTLVTSQTSGQMVRLSQSSGPAVTWTASSNQPWLVVTPSSGSGARELSISVSPNGMTAPSTATGTVTVTLNGAGNTVPPIVVTLALIPTGLSANSIGVVDTPLNNATGVTGAVPFTGWAIDDVEVADVFICRAPVAGESAPLDPNCGGAAQIIVGTGVFIDGTRPDVQAAFPTHPRSSRAGWGFLVLTNMLPRQGNGVFVFHAYAMDRDGHVLLLGTRTMTCDNAHATKPFGTIDTPGQGDTASGPSYVNFGWALTQQPKFIPQDGSTMTVFVDGVAVGSPSYNHYRSDIATLFPGLANSNGAVGFRTIDTTALPNGLHTIVWTATDSAGMTSGLGSRFFRVSNAPGSITAAASTTVASMDRVADVPLDETPLKVRRGWSTDAPWRLYGGRTGRTVIRGEELDRFEIALAESGSYRGYLRVGNELQSLPIGSRLDAGTFTWSPGLGFVGWYDLVFVRENDGVSIGRHEVRIILHAKGSGRVGPQTIIDTPTSLQEVTQPFLLAGWATDLGAAERTGVELVHAWAYPLSGGAPVFLGAATYGGVRPDVAAVYGEQFRDSGYGLAVQGLSQGTYDVAVFAWSSLTGDFVPAKLVRVLVR